MKSFSSRLKELRGARSQVEAAGLIGITQQKWQRLESGRHEPDLALLHNICITFGVSSDWILDLPISKIQGGHITKDVKAKVHDLKNNALTVSQKADDLLRSLEKMEQEL